MKSERIATGGLLSCLSLLFLYLASVTPSAKIAMICLSSFCIGLCVVTINVKFSAIAYVAVSVLGIFILPNKVIAVIFALFFGNYPIAKLYIERINNVVRLWLVKIIVFNIYAIISYFVISSFVNVEINFAIPIIVLIANAVFVIYDIAFSIFVNKIIELRRKKWWRD